MTNEEAIKELIAFKDKTWDGMSEEVIDVAIKALEQQPCERFEWGIDGKVYKITKAKDGKEICQQVCNDAISRQAILDGIEELKKSPWATANRSHGYEYLITEALDVVKDLCVKQVPSVNLQPCDDAISCEAVIEWLKAKDIIKLSSQEETARKELKALPPVTPQQKYGKWIKHPEIETSTPEYLMFYECSECGDKQCFYKLDLHKKRFCNSCGAKMQESE